MTQRKPKRGAQANGSRTWRPVGTFRFTPPPQPVRSWQNHLGTRAIPRRGSRGLGVGGVSAGDWAREPAVSAARTTSTCTSAESTGRFARCHNTESPIIRPSVIARTVTDRRARTYRTQWTPIGWLVDRRLDVMDTAVSPVGLRTTWIRVVKVQKEVLYNHAFLFKQNGITKEKWFSPSFCEL
jgi:hypothetical protein